MASNPKGMIGQKRCPFCQTPTVRVCAHLALAVEARDFVRRCIEMCQGQQSWQAICQWRRANPLAAGRQLSQDSGGWLSQHEDFTWLETAFCAEFLQRLSWFGGTEYEWRAGPKPGQGGFWVLLWSKDPQRLWWELRDELERQSIAHVQPLPPMPTPRSSRTLPLNYAP
jgi:hypothetical protein